MSTHPQPLKIYLQTPPTYPTHSSKMSKKHISTHPNLPPPSHKKSPHTSTSPKYTSSHPVRPPTPTQNIPPAGPIYPHLPIKKMSIYPHPPKIYPYSSPPTHEKHPSAPTNLKHTSNHPHLPIKMCNHPHPSKIYLHLPPNTMALNELVF